MALTIIVAIIAIVRFIFLDLPQIANNLQMKIERSNIYLTQFETGRKLIPLNIDGREVPPIIPIKVNEPATIRFAIVQDNKNTPQITALIVTFPDDAVVVPDSWKGLIWERSMDIANSYGLTLSPFFLLTKGSPYTLPVLYVTFKHAGLIPLSYQLNVNKMDPIKHNFVINTASNYDEEIKRASMPGVSMGTYRVSSQDYSSATAPTVSADSAIIKK